MRDVVDGPLALRSVAEQGEHRGEDGAAECRGRVGAQLPVACARRESLPYDGLVGGQVGGAEQAASVGDVGGDRGGKVTVVHRSCALLGDQRDRVRESVDHHRVAGLDPGAVVVLERGRCRGVPGEDAVAGVVQVVAGGGAEREATSGDRLGRRDHVTPRDPAVAVVSEIEGGERAGGRDRPVADRHGETAAVVGGHLADVGRGCVGGAASTWHGDASVDGDGAVCAGGPDGDERAAGEGHDAWLVDHGREHGRDGCVHGAATVARDGERGVGACRVGRGDADAGGHAPILPAVCCPVSTGGRCVDVHRWRRGKSWKSLVDKGVSGRFCRRDCRWWPLGFCHGQAPPDSGAAVTAAGWQPSRQRPRWPTVATPTAAGGGCDRQR